MPDKKELETRGRKVELEARASENGESIVEGRPIVFGEFADIGGWFRETIDRGALDGTDLTDVRFCLNHDTSFVYARSRRNNPSSTMQLSTDANGLTFTANLDTKNSPKAQDLYAAVQRADIDQMSFMFRVDEDRWEGLDTDYPTRHITKIGTVVEVSAVTFPAYEATSINARGKEALESARSAVETARQSEAADVETKAKAELELEKAKFYFKNH